MGLKYITRIDKIMYNFSIVKFGMRISSALSIVRCVVCAYIAWQ